MPFTHPIKFKNFSNGKAFPFSSPFVFAMVTKYRNLGGHDLAFTLSTSKELLGAFPRQYLGLLNRTKKKDLNLTSRNLIKAWVDYDPVKNPLEVRLSLSSAKRFLQSCLLI
ncbi:hypothetical protein NC652_026433 [Populus alba x Populus x berolinensis]|uniref:Legume lectin domain-containing protein n=2 Tax=Populus alba x Populus x berolinensis TaxID=444605 RepID=A0AAD6MDS3_9ROSI|nr:hypothetical protein NC652_026433 [Populus alba x Populus x berolinensis]KAJ6983070.1 hypothetical protein NC653_026017 [Populus alba x Populus x berolinensis]